ncbi:hypothetical protein TNCV_1807471 [Trichonephila clavipes]|nr:hypothetical protein TNCV_1807471 [Trichonephila clavipes]
MKDVVTLTFINRMGIIPEDDIFQISPKEKSRIDKSGECDDQDQLSADEIDHKLIIEALLLFALTFPATQINGICFIADGSVSSMENVRVIYRYVRTFVPLMEEAEDILSRIVTGDEKWGYPISPQNQSNSRWDGNTHPLSS